MLEDCFAAAGAGAEDPMSTVLTEWCQRKKLNDNQNVWDRRVSLIPNIILHVRQPLTGVTTIPLARQGEVDFSVIQCNLRKDTRVFWGTDLIRRGCRWVIPSNFYYEQTTKTLFDQTGQVDPSNFLVRFTYQLLQPWLLLENFGLKRLSWNQRE